MTVAYTRDGVTDETQNEDADEPTEDEVNSVCTPLRSHHVQKAFFFQYFKSGPVSLESKNATMERL